MAYSMKELLRETEDKYGDYEFLVDSTNGDGEVVEETATFRYYLRVSLEARQQLVKAHDYVTGKTKFEENEDGMSVMVDYVKSTVESLAVTPKDYELVAERLGDDLVLWSFFLEKYADNYGGLNFEDDSKGE